ncbi:MAG: putative DNA-binding protein [Sarcina sp.]
MEDRFEISMLLDYYSSLLTEKQLNIMNLYYNEDLSLAEIADLNKTSRQATFDLIKRCSKQLSAYEEKLKLLDKYRQRVILKERLLNELSVDESFSQEELKIIDSNIDEIINA